MNIMQRAKSLYFKFYESLFRIQKKVHLSKSNLHFFPNVILSKYNCLIAGIFMKLRMAQGKGRDVDLS